MKCGLFAVSAALTLGLPAQAEVWDKELAEEDFDQFEARCAADRESVLSLYGEEGQGEKARNLEAVVVARIKARRHEGDCIEYLGACRPDDWDNPVSMKVGFFDEIIVPNKECRSWWPKEDHWRLATTAGTAYEAGRMLRINH